VCRCCCSVALSVAPTIDVLLSRRFLQAFGTSGGAVIAIAIVRDLWNGKLLADHLSRLVLILGVAPILVPSLGGFIFTAWD
jgi:MFS transporter, DHA1 family, multidrug resistance protein